VPKFNYKAVKPESQGGGEVTGSLNAASAEDVMEALQARGVFPVEIKEQATAAMRGAGAGGQQFKAFKGQTSQTSGGVLSAAKNALTPGDAKRNKKQNVGELLNEMKENQTTIKGLRTPKARFEKRQQDKKDRDNDRRERHRDKIFENMKSSLGTIGESMTEAGKNVMTGLGSGLKQDFAEILGPVSAVLELPFIRTVKNVGFGLAKDLGKGAAGSIGSLFGFKGKKKKGEEEKGKGEDKDKEGKDESGEVPKLLENISSILVEMANGIADRLDKLILATFNGDNLTHDLLGDQFEQFEGYRSAFARANKQMHDRERKRDSESRRSRLKGRLSRREEQSEKKASILGDAVKSVSKGKGGLFRGLFSMITRFLPMLAMALPLLLKGALIVTLIAAVVGAVLLALNWDTVLDFLGEIFGLNKEEERVRKEATEGASASTRETETGFKTKSGKSIYKDHETGEFHAMTAEEAETAEKEGNENLSEFKMRKDFKTGEILGMSDEGRARIAAGFESAEEFQQIMQEEGTGGKGLIYDQLRVEAKNLADEFRDGYVNDWHTDANGIKLGRAWNAWSSTQAGFLQSLVDRVRDNVMQGIITPEQAVGIFAQDPIYQGVADGGNFEHSKWWVGDQFGEFYFPNGAYLEGGKLTYQGKTIKGEHTGSLSSTLAWVGADKPAPADLTQVFPEPTGALAEGGLVRKAMVALMGEAGPEIVMPLDRSVEIVGGMLAKAMDSSTAVHSNTLGKAQLAQDLSTNSKLNGTSSPTVVVANTTNAPTNVTSTNISSTVSSSGNSNHPSFRRSGRDQTRSEMF